MENPMDSGLPDFPCNQPIETSGSKNKIRMSYDLKQQQWWNFMDFIMG